MTCRYQKDGCAATPFLSFWLVDFAFASPLLKHFQLLFAVSLCPLGILLPRHGVSTSWSWLFGCWSCAFTLGFNWASIPGISVLEWEPRSWTPVYRRCDIKRLSTTAVLEVFSQCFIQSNFESAWYNYIYSPNFSVNSFKSFKICQIKLYFLPISLSIQRFKSLCLPTPCPTLCPTTSRLPKPTAKDRIQHLFCVSGT